MTFPPSAPVYVEFHHFTVESGPREDATEQHGRAAIFGDAFRTSVQVLTGVASGLVTVRVEALSSRPAADAGEEWEDVAEVSVEVDGDGPLGVFGFPSDQPDHPSRLDAHGPGTYRVRVSATGRDLERDAPVHVAQERYLVQAWPEAYAPVRTLRATSEVATGEVEEDDGD